MFIPSVALTVTRRRRQLWVATLLALKWLNLSIFVNMFSALAAYYRQKIMQAERRLKVLATVDALTGLNNRRHFESDA